MKTRPIDPLDMTIWNYEYIKCAMAICPAIQSIKDSIEHSDKKLVITPAEELIKYMEQDLKDKSFNQIYNNLKFVMLVHGIIIKNAFHISGKRVFIMRFATYRDKMPDYWKKRSKFLKKLMKSIMWKYMIESRNVDNSDKRSK
jgi:hypothetical protein